MIYIFRDSDKSVSQVRAYDFVTLQFLDTADYFLVVHQGLLVMRGSVIFAQQFPFSGLVLSFTKSKPKFKFGVPSQFLLLAFDLRFTNL